MAVYVDPTIDYGAVADARGLPSRRWAHLTADSPGELHAFARRLGLQRDWFQGEGTWRWHYDVTDRKREAAIQAGARPVTRRELLHIMRARPVRSV